MHAAVPQRCRSGCRIGAFCQGARPKTIKGENWLPDGAGVNHTVFLMPACRPSRGPCLAAEEQRNGSQ